MSKQKKYFKSKYHHYKNKIKDAINEKRKENSSPKPHLILET
jgi:hypothetical protein